MYEINIDGEERKICCNCVDKLRIGWKPDKLKKLEHNIVYSTEKSEEDEEEVEGGVLGDGGAEVSIVPVVYPLVMVSI